MGLEEEARKRRERLKALRKAKEDGGPPPKTLHTESNQESLPNPELKLRNYKPQDDKLNATELEKPKPVHLDNNIQEQLEASKPQAAIEGEVDLLNLAPRKIDWDLKRAIKDKLDKLERRTQKAIAEYIRDRLKASNGNTAEISDAVKGI